MEENEQTLEQMAACLKHAVESATNRITNDGRIAGWRGFHIDLDYAEQLIEAMRAKVRGG